MAAPTTTPVDLAAAYVMEPMTAADWLAVTPMALCITFGAVLMMIRHRTDWHPPVALTALALLVLNNVLLLMQVVSDGPLTMMMGRWLPPFGIAITVDLTGALLGLAAAIVAFCGTLYAHVEINTSGRRYGFYPLLMLLMAGVSGAFLTGDIFNLYVWFEVLLISSFGLLILGSEREQIDGALKRADFGKSPDDKSHAIVAKLRRRPAQHQRPPLRRPFPRDQRPRHRSLPRRYSRPGAPAHDFRQPQDGLQE